jgi:hypothetical protein
MPTIDPEQYSASSIARAMEEAQPAADQMVEQFAGLKA